MRGYLDKNLTVGLKREKGKSRLTEKNTDRLKLARDLLRDFKVEATINPKDKINNNLKIEGFQNHKNLRNNVGLENSELITDLDNLLENPKNFVKYEGREFNRLGNELGEIMNSAIDYYRPNTVEYKLKDDKNAFGKKIKPDKIRQHLDGRIESIDIKLREENVKSKDINYASNSEITEVTIAYWDGVKETTEKKFGKNFHYNNLQKFRDNLRQEREKVQQVEEREKIDGILDRFDKFEDNLKKEEERVAKEAMKNSNEKNWKKNNSRNTSGVVDKAIDPIQEGEKQEDGGNDIESKPESKQQGDKSTKSEPTTKEVSK